MDGMSRSVVSLLNLLSAGGGEVDSRVRIQKTAYILKLVGEPNFRQMKFKFHFYGPYCREISDALSECVNAGLVVETQEEFDNEHVRYSYRLTPVGETTVALDLMAAGSRDLVSVLMKYHWRELEIVSTILFLINQEGLAKKDAEIKAYRLKPKCKKFKPRADQLMATLSGQSQLTLALI